MEAMKQEQRDRKKYEGEQIVYTQISRSSSMSSSDIEELDRLEEAGEMSPRHIRHQIMREAGARADAAKIHLKEYRPNQSKDAWKGSARQLHQDGGPAGPADASEATTANPPR